jgi:hypothetical protein
MLIVTSVDSVLHPYKPISQREVLFPLKHPAPHQIKSAIPSTAFLSEAEDLLSKMHINPLSFVPHSCEFLVVARVGYDAHQNGLFMRTYSKHSKWFLHLLFLPKPQSFVPHLCALFLAQGWDTKDPTPNSFVIPSEALFSGAEGPASVFTESSSRTNRGAPP